MGYFWYILEPLPLVIPGRYSSSHFKDAFEVGKQICPVQNPLDLGKFLTYTLWFFRVIAAWKSSFLFTVESCSVLLTLSGRGLLERSPQSFERNSCLGAALELELCPQSCVFPGHCVNAKLCWNEFEWAAA